MLRNEEAAEGEESMLWFDIPPGAFSVFATQRNEQLFFNKTSLQSRKAVCLFTQLLRAWQGQPARPVPTGRILKQHCWSHHRLGTQHLFPAPPGRDTLADAASHLLHHRLQSHISWDRSCAGNRTPGSPHYPKR